jgi:predicted nucleotidyltransferase
MRPSQVLEQKRDAVAAAMRECDKVANPRIFGSVARGDDVDGSDIDFLVDALPGASLFDLGGLQYRLEEILGVQVHLVTSEELPRFFRDRVLAEAVTL